MADTIVAKGMTDNLTAIFAMVNHLTATILTKGKKGRSDDQTSIFAMGDYGTSCQHATQPWVASGTETERSCISRSSASNQAEQNYTCMQETYMPGTAPHTCNESLPLIQGRQLKSEM